jgi:hypothetical protein
LLLPVNGNWFTLNKQNQFKMKKIVLIFALAFTCVVGEAQTTAPVIYEYKLFTTVESVISGGLGRSRLIATDKSSQIVEKDLENFFSLVGINFNNIQSNDQIITAKINEYAKDGFELYQVAPGVYSSDEKKGIFLTRYVFRKKVSG